MVVIESEVVSNYSINKDVLEGQQDENNYFTVNKDLVIQGLNIYPVLETSKTDGISIELISPNNTGSTILFPENLAYPLTHPTAQGFLYPGTT